MATEKVRVNIKLRGNSDVWEQANEKLKERLDNIQRGAAAAGMTMEETQEAMRMFARSLHETDQELLPMRGWEWEDQKELL